MSVRLGLILNSQFPVGDDPTQRTAELIEQVRHAREAGFSSVWAIHHFLARPFQMLQQWPLLGRLTAEAGDMTVGTCIFQLTLSNPVYAAEQAATMDALTGGRFVFAVGLGFRDEEFLAFGVDPRKKVSRFEECLNVAMRLWTEDAVDHHGEHFDLDGAQLLLKTVQKPHPPVWIAGSGDRAVRRAVRYGMPWLINPHATLATVERQMKLHRETLDEHGHAVPAHVPVFRELAIGDSYEKSVRVARPYLEAKYAAYADWGLHKPLPADEDLSVPFEPLSKDRFIIGDPVGCLEEINRYTERLGATDLLIRLQWPGMEQKHVLHEIKLLGEEVIPELNAGSAIGGRYVHG